MRWTVVWSRCASAALLAMPWRQGTRVEAAVLRFASTSDGDVQELGGDPHDLRLVVGAYAARLRLEPAAGVVRVLYVVRR